METNREFAEEFNKRTKLKGIKLEIKDVEKLNSINLYPESFTFKFTQKNRIDPHYTTIGDFLNCLKKEMLLFNGIGVMYSEKIIDGDYYSAKFFPKYHMSFMYNVFQEFIESLLTDTSRRIGIWHENNKTNYSLQNAYHFLQGSSFFTDMSKNCLKPMMIFTKKYKDFDEKYKEEYSGINILFELLEENVKHFYSFQLWLERDPEYINSNFQVICDLVRESLDGLS